MSLTLAFATLGGLGVFVSGAAAGEAPGVFFGHITSGEKPVVGAMVSFSHGEPAHALTVFSDEQGRYLSPPLVFESGYDVRVRRIGWKDARRKDLSPSSMQPLSFELERVEAAPELAEQLPANYWYALVLDQLEEPAERAELKQQCTYCHQQGNWATRRERTHEEWEKLILLMGRRGAMISQSLRAKLPDAFVAAYAPENALPKLLAERDTGSPVAPATPEARRALIEEWDLGGRASTQHDVMMHPDGRLYSVDGPQDALHRLDSSIPGGGRESWTVPRSNLPPGGVFASSAKSTSTSISHVGPHSLQTAPDGSIWITLAAGNQLARFDVETETWTIHEVADGIYPHTLRFDAKGRIWYTMAASNHIGMFDPETGEQQHIRLPARTWMQAIILRTMPYLLKIGDYIDIRGSAAEGDGIKMPVPYGIDIAPDGGVWFSQLNERRIGRVNPETLSLEMIDTPFETPRRLRFDSKGGLWIPSFSESLLAHFDLETRVFRTWPLPVEPLGSDTPYALAIDQQTDVVWICGTNSDSMIRFEPETEHFTVYPLPTRVTYTREVDFDRQGRVWTSNSNGPTWQIEGGVPKVVRIDPSGAPSPAASPLFAQGATLAATQK
ncbi:MAG: hypothetical protein VX466_02615 [Myxococcota bacterium]|nr:hypothetical protein [Myxococcota bacterium]